MSRAGTHFVSTVLREPVVQFLAIGAALAAFGRIGWPEDDRHRIMIDAELVSLLTAGYENQFGEAPDARALQELIDRHVEEEVLYREALELSLDKEDMVVRRRIVQKMRFLVEDQSASDPPTNDELETWYRANADRYVVPMTLAFTHVYFGIDGRTEAAARARAEAALDGLRVADATRGTEQGDRFPGSTEFGALSLADLRRTFGASELSDRLPSAPVGAWSGPYRSGYGWHLVYVSDRNPSRLAPLSEVRDQVERDRAEEGRAAWNEKALDQLRAKYIVIRPDDAS